MYLSRVELDTNRRDTMRALAYPGVMHGAVERCFKDKTERKLWRIDYLGPRCCLLVESLQLPDFSSLVAQFCTAPCESLCRPYDAFLDALKLGQKCSFRLTANPVHCTKKEVSVDDPKMRGAIRAHVTQDQQCDWLIQRAESCGFALELGERIIKTARRDNEIVTNEYWTHPSFDIVQTRWAQFHKGDENRNSVTLRTACFEGTLTISDPVLFKDKLIHGIGRGKAYGCGLMTVIPVRVS